MLSQRQTHPQKRLVCDSAPPIELEQRRQMLNAASRVLLMDVDHSLPRLESIAESYTGSQTGDWGRFGRCFWEMPAINNGWVRQLSTVDDTCSWGGRENVNLWQDGDGELVRNPSCYIRGRAAWGRQGVLVLIMGRLPVTLYSGEFFDDNAAAIVPEFERDVPAVWAFCASSEFEKSVRALDSTIKVTNKTLVKVPFDIERWRESGGGGPDGLPEPWSDDPTQWLFGAAGGGDGSHCRWRWRGWWDTGGRSSRVGRSRRLADADGIVCLPAVAGSRRRRIGSAAARDGVRR